MKFACVGECMIEIANLPDGSVERRFGGDTLNTAIYLARYGVAVDYVTALGDDPFSYDMISAWRSEGIGVDLIQFEKGAVPGLYMIRNDADGECTFHYWRDQAPAKRMFAGDQGALLGEALTTYDWIYLSGITLSILSRTDQGRLLAALRKAREKGVRVAFDGNFRSRGWASTKVAVKAFGEFLPEVDLALPTFDDERILYLDEDPMRSISRYHDQGISEVVMKMGSAGAIFSGLDGVFHVEVPERIEAIDTTAAGDSFNAGYLASRSVGCSFNDSVLAGHRLAAVVIKHRGAIIPRNAMPAYSGN